MNPRYFLAAIAVEATLTMLCHGQEQPQLLTPPVVGAPTQAAIAPAHVMPAVAIESSTTHVTPSHTLTIVRTEPIKPNAASTPEPSAARFAAAQSESVQQPLVEQKFMMIGATVFAHQTSKIQWYEDGIFHESLVGWDLNALTGVGDFLYKGAQYSLLMAISNEDNADAPEISQAGPDGVVPLSGGESASNPASILTALYLAQKPVLDQALAARQQEEAERMAAAQNLPQHPPVTIWLRPGKGSKYTKQAEEAAKTQEEAGQ